MFGEKIEKPEKSQLQYTYVCADPGGRSHDGIVGNGGMDICLLRVLSGRGLCDEPITRPEESYRVWLSRFGLQRHTKKIKCIYIYIYIHAHTNTYILF